MQRLNNESSTSTTIQELCEEYRALLTRLQRKSIEQNRVKRGLRNADGTGVWRGDPCVQCAWYLIADGDKMDEGKLTYRGISVSDIVAGCEKGRQVWLRRSSLAAHFSASCPIADSLTVLRPAV